MRLGKFTSLADDRRCGSVALPAAAVAARAHFAAGDHDHMADLARHAVASGKHLAADDDAAADAGTERDEHAVLCARGYARNGFSQTRDRRVVIDENGLVQILVHFSDQRHMMPAEVRAERYDFGLRITDAGNTDADRLHIVHGNIRLLRRLYAQIRHIVNDSLIAALHARGAADLRENFSAFVHNARLDAGSAQIDSDVIHIQAPPEL